MTKTINIFSFQSMKISFCYSDVLNSLFNMELCTWPFKNVKSAYILLLLLLLLQGVSMVLMGRTVQTFASVQIPATVIQKLASVLQTTTRLCWILLRDVSQQNSKLINAFFLFWSEVLNMDSPYQLWNFSYKFFASFVNLVFSQD